jgi:acyl-CoA reductase-like NAD-dependent aldehyde dehydrogenase
VRLALIPLLCLSVAAACGGDDSLSKAELVKRGDAICTESNRKLEPVFAKAFKPGEGNPPADKAAPVLEEAAQIVRNQYERFADLNPPKADKKEFDRFAENFESTVKFLDEAAKAAKKGDTEGYLKQLQLANEADSSTAEAMKRFGFRACAGVTES